MAQLGIQTDSPKHLKLPLPWRAEARPLYYLQFMKINEGSTQRFCVRRSGENSNPINSKKLRKS